MESDSSSATSATYVFGDRIYTGNVDKLRTSLEPYFRDETPHRVILDLARVRLCDSYGLRLLINLRRKAAAMSKELILYRPDHIFRDILENTKLSHVFTVVDSLEDDPQQKD